MCRVEGVSWWWSFDISGSFLGKGGPFDLADSEFKAGNCSGDEEGVHGLGSSDLSYNSWSEGGGGDGGEGSCLRDRGVAHDSWTREVICGGGGWVRVVGLGGHGVVHSSWTVEDGDAGDGLGGRGVSHGSWTWGDGDAGGSLGGRDVAGSWTVEEVCGGIG